MLRTVFAAVLLASPALVPSAGATYQARSFLDLSGGFDAGDGIGLYDASNPPNYCLVLLDLASPVAVLNYYIGLRYWPGSASAPSGASFTAPEPTDCAGMVPGDNVNVEPFTVTGGGAFWINDAFPTPQVANLATGTMTLEYCSGAPVALPGPPGVVQPPLGAFTGRSLVCGGDGTDVLYPQACASFSLAMSLGRLFSTAPVFLEDGGCNSLQGSPAGVDFAVQRCAAFDLHDLVTGVVTHEPDSDFFVVAQDGSMAAWTRDMGIAPAAMFPHVSNLEPNVGC